MKRIPQIDWDRVHELACDIVNASSKDDDVLIAAHTESLMCLLKELEVKYGSCSRITATIADFTDDESLREQLHRTALTQARAEGDIENERLILDSLTEEVPDRRA